MRKTNRLWRGFTALFTFVFVLTLVLSWIASGYIGVIDTALGTTSEIFVSEDSANDPLYDKFTPPAEYLNADGTGNSNALIAGAIDLNRREAAEGSVLLKNNAEEGQGLPLPAGSKVTLFGIRSEVSLLGSSFGVKAQGPMITLNQALSQNQTDFANTIATTTARDRTTGTTSINQTIKEWTGDEFEFEGAGFEVNPTMRDIYVALDEKYPHAENESSGANYDPAEPSIADISGVNPDYEASFATYGDAAIVVVSRPSAESQDYLEGSVAEGLGYTEPLALTQNERDIIAKAKAASNNVIVLINASNTMEIDELKNDPEIDSILWIGFPGSYGMLGVADILCGRVSPSGGLWDIFAANNLSTPAMMNMGDFTYANAEDEITRAKSDKYVIEAEGIYVGYRYYETRYYDAVLGQGNASSPVGAYESEGNWSYADEVSYGFGYGLSYTTFTQEIVGDPVYEISKNAETGQTDAFATFNVKVTNTGNVAGKSIVQIYAQAPYITGGVEKSAIALLNFGKTQTLEPGASETVQVKCDMQFLASYDNTYDNGDGTFGTYILDPGKYYYAVGNGAHDALNNIMALQGVASDQLVGEANADLAYEQEITEDFLSKTAFSVSKTGQKISNQLDYADWNYFQPGEVTYLSRADWAGTYPKKYEVMNVTNPDLLGLLNGGYYTIKTGEDTSAILWEQDNQVMFYQMAGKEFDDPAWEDILNKMTLEEAQYLVTYGGPTIPKVESIGLAEAYVTENAGNGLVVALNATKDPNAPWAIGADDPNGNWNPQVFGSSPLMASSYNVDLFKEIGEFVGVESLFTGIPILWGPGLNTHRHQYNGRNGEYFSEDPVLSGIAAMEEAIGALEYGLVVAPKHFAFNDQETNRGGVAPYMTEQRAREIELRAYQIAFEATKYDTEDHDAGMRGLMVSFSKIGPVECTASRELMTNILKDEWGFQGYAVTDIYDDFDVYGGVLTSGTTNYDIRGASGFYSVTILENDSRFANQVDGTNVTPTLFEGDAYAQESIKSSVHNMLYALTQSNLMNRYNSTTRVDSQMTWWSGTLLAVTIVSGVLTLGSAALYIASVRRKESGETK